uniref:Transcription factor bHLH69-like n=1 Tax=Elaeis guineensis var. tenera TaxID=51953 RepID=A0A6J0PNG3_ELAGV|nr:transcription factor bHLH69-like [Elaeis guineensis]
MVASLKSCLLALNSTGMSSRQVGTNQSGTCSLLIKAMQHHALRRRKQIARSTKRIGGGTVAPTRPQMVSRKKWALLEGSRKPRSHIERRMKKLRRLLPNGESVGLEGLFGEAADYIMSLQMQVKVMQIMVSVLSPMDSDD